MRRWLGALVAAWAAISLVAAPAIAEPAEHKARVTGRTDISANRTALFIHSPAMGRTIEVQVLHPASDKPRPSLYLLDGVSPEGNRSDWLAKTDIVSFFAGKNVNVVLPIGGQGSYYTNWQRPDPVLGASQWETFLTAELPPIIDSVLKGNGRNAIGGLSMGGSAALTLMTLYPQLYAGVAAFSACPSTVDAAAQRVIRVTVESKGGNPTNMWGPPNDPAWVRNDPMTHAPALKGKKVHITVGSGIADPRVLDAGSAVATVDAVIPGGMLERGALACTQQFEKRLASLSIPATFIYKEIGTHAWPYWQHDLHTAWPDLAAALGL